MLTYKESHKGIRVTIRAKALSVMIIITHTKYIDCLLLQLNRAK